MLRFIVRNLRSFIKPIKRKYYTFRVSRQAKFVGNQLKVNGKSFVNNQTELGHNVNFNGMQIHGGGKVRIGNNFHSGVACMMITSIHNYDHGEAVPYDSTYIHKDIIIEDNVWLGSKVIILGGIEIGEGAIIQAGSTVVSDIPKYGIAGGSPAKVFKYRDIEHYTRLKNEKKFH